VCSQTRSSATFMQASVRASKLPSIMVTLANLDDACH
jgi:hypothetical protein